MANLFEHKDRRVVPNWRSFGKTTRLGELNSFQMEKSNDTEETSIVDYVIDWKIFDDEIFLSGGWLIHFFWRDSSYEVTAIVICKCRSIRLNQPWQWNRQQPRPT